MSTNFEHSQRNTHLSFETIDREVRKFDISLFTAPAAVQTHTTQTERLVTVYASARPILVALEAIPFLPASWRAVLTVLTATIDGISTSFRTGSSDAPAQAGATAAMEPKLPAGRQDEE